MHIFIIIDHTDLVVAFQEFYWISQESKKKKKILTDKILFDVFLI